MKVTLQHITPLHIVSGAIRECYNSHDKADSCVNEETGEIEVGEGDRNLIHKIGNVYKHASTLEHLVASIRIEGVSRLILQEFARHRIASLSVKSTRFTLQELKDEPIFDNTNPQRANKYIVFPPEHHFEDEIEYSSFVSDQIRQLELLRQAIASGRKRDVAKYLVPDSYKTNISWTINARSLQNFLYLRSAKNAHFEIQELAHKVYEALPDNYKYLFTEYMHGLEEKQK